VRFQDNTGFAIGTVNTAGLTTSGNTTLSTTNTVTQSQALSASGLELLGAGGTFTLNTQNNAVTTLAGNTGSVNFQDNTGFAIGTVNTAGLTTSGNTTLSTTATVTQSQALNAAGLELLGAGGTYTLNTVNNTVATLAGNTGSVNYRDGGGVAIGTVNTVGLTASGDISLDARAGAITGAVDADNLTLAATGNINVTSNVNTLTASTTGGTLSVTEADDITLTDLTTTNALITVTATGGGIHARSVNAGTANVVLNAQGGAITDDPSGRVTADSLTATSNGAMTISTDVNTIFANTTASGLITLIDYGSVELSDVQNNNGGIQAFVSADLTASIVQASGGDVRLNASNMTLGDVAASGTVFLAAGGTINGGIFSGSYAEMNASTAGLSAPITANVPDLEMILTEEVDGKSGAFVAGGAMATRPADDNIQARGTVTIDPFTIYFGTLVDVDISAILSSLATQSSASQQLEALLDATTASEFFMSPPLEIYIDMAEQSEFEDSVEDSLGE